MSVLNIDQIVDTLVEKTQYSRDEIMNMIEETIKKQDGLINELGAAHILAGNLGISTTTENQTTIKINDIQSEATGITLIGRVSKIYPIRTFERKDGNQGKVRNIELVDDTGEIRVALWDKKAEAIDEDSIEIGDLVRVTSVNARRGYQDRMELSVGSQSVLEKTDPDKVDANIPEIEKAPLKTVVEINQVEDKTDVSIKGKVSDKRDSPTTFTKNDGSEGRVSSIRLLDTTGEIRLTFWDNDVEKVDDLKVDDVVLITDVNVGSSDYGKELTYRAYSRIKSIEDEELAKAESTRGSPQMTNSGEVTALKDIEDNMRGVNVTGKIVLIGQLNSFERDGETNYVGNITIADSSNYQRRVTLWRDQAKKINDFSIGDVISITNASSKYNDYSSEVELSVNDYSTMEIITDQVDPEEYEYEPEFLKFNQLTETRRNVSIKLRLNKIFETRTITRSDGSESQVLNASVQDGNGTDGRLAAWNDDIAKITDLVEGNDYDFVNVRLKQAGEYPAEVTINAMTKIKETELEIDTTFQTASDFQQTNYQKTSLVNAVPGTRVEVQGNITSIYPPSYYDACTICGKSVNTVNDDCAEHGDMVVPKMIITAMLDDTTAVIEMKLFNDAASRAIEMDASEAKAFAERMREDKAPVSSLADKDYVVKGRIVETSYQEIPKTELHVDEIHPVDFDKKSSEFIDKF